MSRSTSLEKRPPSERRAPVYASLEEEREDGETDPWGTVLAVGMSLMLVVGLCAIAYFVGWARSMPVPH